MSGFEGPFPVRPPMSVVGDERTDQIIWLRGERIRLQKENAKLQLLLVLERIDHSKLNAQFDGLLDQVAKLRAALEDIARGAYEDADCKLVARAALNEETK